MTPEDRGTDMQDSRDSGGISRRRAIRLMGAGLGGAALAGGGGFWGYRRSLRVSSSDQAAVGRR
ncbi:MAG: hypothetical protein EA352_08565 [Gemmatimonadales bacterium]|nr:MAG: hypothetical protein EA352_08565 [Gemmatimonadales bacterium]